MSNEENFLEQSFHLVEEAENLATIYEYDLALAKLKEALALFDQSTIPMEEKQQAIDMIAGRVSELENMIQSQSSQGNQTGDIHKSPTLQTPLPKGLRPPPVFGVERDQMIKLGLKALANSEELINNGHLYRAYKSITYAYSHLSQAHYDDTKVENIGKIALFLASKLQKAGYNVNLAQEIDNYSPSFLSTDQLDYLPDGSRASSSGDRGRIPSSDRAYTPTFLTTDQISYGSAPQGRKPGSHPEKEYIPTFTKTQQPDFADKSGSRVPYGLKHSKSTDDYVPTFAKTDQVNIIPTFGRATQEQGTQTSKGEIKVDFEGLNQMFSFLEKGEPIPESLTATPQFPDEEVLHSEAQSQKSRKEGLATRGMLTTGTLINPIYHDIIDPALLQKWKIDLATIKGEEFDEILLQRQSIIELHAQEVLDNFETTQTEQNAKREAVLEYIDLIHPFEKSYDYESAITTTYKVINKLSKLSGWADQALVLYAWLLILKEKSRTSFRLGDSGSEFDLGRINTEFVQIMTNALNTSKEVAISFIGEDFNQELNAQQIYKAKLEDQAKLQDSVFELLDTGNLKLINEQFPEAIACYNHAVLTLNSLDWSKLRNSIESLIEDISDMKQLYDLSLVRKFSPEEMKTLSSMARSSQEGRLVAKSNQELKNLMLRRYKVREDRIEELERQIRQQTEQKYKALSLISQGEGMLLSDLYDETIEAYEEAINILIGAGWEGQIPIITDRLVKIRDMREIYIRNEQEEYDQMFRRNVERRLFEDSITHSVKQQLLEYEMEEHTPEELAKKSDEMEFQKKDIFEKLADVENLATQNHLAEAILALKPLKEKLEQHQWDAHLPFIYDFVTMVQEQQKAKEIALEQEQKQQKEIEEFKGKIEAYLDEQAQKISVLQDRKSHYLHDFQTYMNTERATSNDAMELMERAEEHIKRKEFQLAIKLYQEADLYFAKLGWNVNIQQQIHRTRQLEFDYKRFFTEYELQAQRKKELDFQKQRQKEKQIAQERNALSDIHSMLSSIRSRGKTAESDNQDIGPSSPSPSPSSDHPKIITDANQIEMNKQKSKPVSKAKKENEEEKMDELQKMIRDAAKKE
ncbi:MAG: hypothetical protein ACTSYI_08365 [Promethearchaeota archaeon]